MIRILTYLLPLLPLSVLAQPNPELDSMTSLLKTEMTGEEKVDLMVSIADKFGSADSGLWVSYSEQAMKLAEQIGYEKGLVDATYMRAAMDMTFGQIHSAALGFQQVVDLARKIDYKPGEAKGLNGLGATRDFQGDYSGALEYLFAAVKINEELGDLRSASSRYNNIGLVYYSQEDFQNAILYFEKALEVYEKINLQSSIALVNGNVGELYLKIRNIDRAEKHFTKALKLYTQLEEPYGKANMQRNLGDVQRIKGSFEEALSYYTTALSVYQELGRQQFVAQIFIGMGITYYQKNEWTTARRYLTEGVELSEDLDHILSIREGSEYLALVEEELGNHRAALEAQKKFKKAADEILNTEQTRSLTRQGVEYEFQKEKDSLAFEQQKATFALEKRIQRKNWIINTVIIVSIFLAIITVLSYRSYLNNKRKNLELGHKNEIIQLKNDELSTKHKEISDLRETEKQLAEEALALKERELTTVTMLSHEKNTILKHLGDEIGRMSHQVNKEVLPDLKELKKLIRANLNEESWKMFMYQFEKVHPSFFDNLKNSFPALTPHDLRICAYIKVGMDNKEIANISNVTHGGIKKSINRMKKKMDLTPEMDLRDFLITL